VCSISYYRGGPRGGAAPVCALVRWRDGVKRGVPYCGVCPLKQNLFVPCVCFLISRSRLYFHVSSRLYLPCILYSYIYIYLSSHFFQIHYIPLYLTVSRERSDLLANSVCFVSKCVLWCFAVFCGCFAGVLRCFASVECFLKNSVLRCFAFCGCFATFWTCFVNVFCDIF